MRAGRLRIEARVQGVGYRDGLERGAGGLALDAWVRNPPGGSVGALIGAPETAVQALLSACRRGPPLARVDAIEESLAEPPDQPGFRRLPTR